MSVYGVNLSTANFGLLSRRVVNGEVVLSHGDVEIIVAFLSLKKNKTGFNYYYLLRIIGFILELDSGNINKIPEYFVDGQFISVCYSKCPESKKHMTRFQKFVYLGDSTLSRLTRKVMVWLAIIKV